MTGVAAAADDPANAYKYRSELMKTLSGHVLAIVAVLNGEVAYGAHVKGHAEAVKAISVMMGDVFPEGSDVPGSRARPEIWQQWDKFRAGHETFKIEAAKLAEVAAGGDLAAVGAQLGNLGNACGGCHKPFRKPKN